MSRLVPKYEGREVAASKWQHLRARNGVQSLEQVCAEDSRVIESAGMSTQVAQISVLPVCGCRISESGLIDKSLCRISHLLYACPYIARWCDMTTECLIGCGYMAYFSGWARPSALALLGRFATREAVAYLIQRTDSGMLHVNYKFEHILRFDNTINEYVVDIYSSPKHGIRGRDWLLSAPPDQRIGVHYRLPFTNTE